MKLNEAKPFFESSQDLEEHFFSIQDQGMLFDILRSKMYSNPILAICREISSNARDAHREAGKPELPIEIHLPLGLEPYYSIKDYGPGISPDRMINIFIKYTASTKREDNMQTGGFGLGAKTPFSYSDQFQVTTINDGIKYSYLCSIDDTKVGKLGCLDKRATDERNSTEISIPVKPQDYNFFRQYTEQACRHWDVKPIISGAQAADWQKINKVLEGPGWAITNDQNNYQRGAKLVIDGIEYPLDYESLRKYADAKLIDSARGSFIMYFGIGELSLSATRESIHLDKPTETKIRDRLDFITKEIKQKVLDKIDAFPNLWQANVYYRKELSYAFSNLVFLGPLSWKNYSLNTGYCYVKCPVFAFIKGKNGYRYKADPNKITRSDTGSITFDEKSVLFINDLPIKEPTPRHIKKAFDDNPALVSVQIVCPNDKYTLADLDKEIHLSEMAPTKLSTITKASSRAYTAPTSRLLIFKYDFNAAVFCQVSYDNMKEDTTDKVLCLLNHNNYPDARLPVLANKKVLGLGALKALLERNSKISFYGVYKDTDPKRLTEEFNDFVKLDAYLDTNILNNSIINYVEIKIAHKYYRYSDSAGLSGLDKLEPLILDKNSLFLKRLKLYKNIKRLGGNDSILLDIYESVKGVITDTVISQFVTDNPNWDIEKINSDYINKYPLLASINTYNYTYIAEHIAQYVNMIDKI